MEQQTENNIIEWIGEIPDNWKISKIGELYSYKNIKVNDEDYPPLSVTKMGILPQLENAAKSDAHDDRKLVNTGDFVINSRSDRRGSCGISSLDGSVSLINIVLSPKSILNSDYYNWLFHTPQFADEFYKWGHGIVDDLWTTNWQNMKNIIIPIPSLEEQKSIANFLNKKCAFIDSLINAENTIRDKLIEYKLSLITEIVTKGLNNNVKFKDTDIEWIGKIPNHWNLIRLKYVVTKKAQYGANCEPEQDYNKFDYRYVRITDIDDNASLKDEIVYLSAEDAEGFVLNEGDILFARSGATVGKSYLYNKNDGKCCFAGYLIRYVPNKKKLNPKYLLYFTFSNLYIEWIKIVATQSTIQNVSANKYDNLILPLPSINEQKEIIDYLDKKCAPINLLIIEKEKVISKLEEYKNSLIFEYVTGKREVQK